MTPAADGLRIGVDIVPVGRVDDLLARHGDRFVDHVLTRAERRDRRACDDSGDAERIAGKLACKEATFKLVGVRNVLRWKEIEILPDADGAPSVVLAGATRATADRRSVSQVHASITHDGEYAVAVAVSLPRTTSRRNPR